MTHEVRAAPRAASMRSAWYAVILLLLLYCMSFIDRLILSLLAPALSAAFQISDVKLGVLFGMGFGVVYGLTGLPLAHLIDKSNRVRMVTFGVLLWSVCTIGSAFAPNYTALVILRAGVAVGEAVLSPAAISIIADLFPREKRSAPTTAYMAVSTFMGAGAFVIGGAALDLGTHLSAALGMEPWRLALVFVGLPGIAMGLLFYSTVREPVRAPAPANEQFSTAGQAIGYVAKEFGLYGYVYLAAAMLTMTGFAASAWAPTLMVRTHGLTPAHAGYLYGTVGLVTGLIGAVLWPVLVEAWSRKGRKDALIIAFTIGITGYWICAATLALTPSIVVMLAAVGAATFFTTAGAVLIPMIFQNVTPGRMRGRVMAGYLMANNLVGFTIGPPLAAWIAERFFTGPHAIGYGMAAIALVGGPIASVAVWMTRKAYLRALVTAEARERAADEALLAAR
ncbi:MAG: MFS transporter [Phenylobacterium sp.]|uniref:MFS transporter n=1 Tax=Phenylobacterium sp. TaxID=1871053 RepID=UPI002735E660|nr:MFS transporter [Phenylobacterium sp.]MDP3172856.1 MFS transporter [Phenylobacterium sp.]